MRSRKFLIIGIVLFISLLAILLVKTSSTQGGIDSFDEDASIYNSTKYVVLKDPNEQLTVEQLTPNYRLVLSETLREYAEREYELYSDESIIGFLIKGVDNEETSLKISGQFGESKGDEIFYIQKLENNIIRFEYSRDNEKVFDDTFNINSKINQFIGSLPVDTDGFTVDYSQEGEEFLVTLNSNVAAFEKAKKFLVEGTGVKDINELNVLYLGDAGMPDPADY